MRRSAMSPRTRPIARAAIPREVKPPAGPRRRKCKCCGGGFVAHGIECWCSPECGYQWSQVVLARRALKAQRAERASDKARRDALKGYWDLVAEAQVAFNRYIRRRDELAGFACICCGRDNTKSYLTGSAWDCGHYRSTGSAHHLRFHEDNAHRQLSMCNQHGAGRAVEYRAGLIRRIGLARVEALEADQGVAAWTHEDLRAIKKHYSRKYRELREATCQE